MTALIFALTLLIVTPPLGVLARRRLRAERRRWHIEHARQVMVGICVATDNAAEAFRKLAGAFADMRRALQPPEIRR